MSRHCNRHRIGTTTSVSTCNSISLRTNSHQCHCVGLCIHTIAPNITLCSRGNQSSGFTHTNVLFTCDGNGWFRSNCNGMSNFSRTTIFRNCHIICSCHIRRNCNSSCSSKSTIPHIRIST